MNEPITDERLAEIEAFVAEDLDPRRPWCQAECYLHALLAEVRRLREAADSHYRDVLALTGNLNP